MKKYLSILLISAFIISSLCAFTGCTPGTNGPTPLPDIDPTTVDVICETWRATELTFNSSKEYSGETNEAAGLLFDVVFTHKDTGVSLTIPGFWDGGTVYKVRFAPTKYGIWEYKTVCEADASLNGKIGTLGANAYKGDLEIYKRGFVKVDPAKKYFVFDDNTPFFYLGDTHWGMFNESFDTKGDNAGDIQTDSHFKYIVDKRIEQGFTVYQSEPIGSKFDLTDGILGANDIAGFQDADRYYKYIADKGLVHANAQICFPTFADKIASDNAALEVFARYWVARFGAYPVMWTLAQEIDNDFFHEKGNQSHITAEDNMWVRVAEFMNKYDAYDHPLSGHQEGSGSTSITGESATTLNKSNGGKSVFASEEVTKRTGHNWWACQTHVDYKDDHHFKTAQEYWASSKVAIMYESKYCYLWTKNFGARVQGWVAYLNGFYGYGYGAQDIWCFGSSFGKDKQTHDGVELVTVKDKQIQWHESVEFESAYQVGYMRQFLQQLEWWNLIPDFDKNNYYSPSHESAQYSCATIGNDVYVIYIFGSSAYTGMIRGLDASATYTVKWYNPKTNEYTLIGDKITANAIDGEGNPVYNIGQKPDLTTQDWVILATKNK